MLAVIIEYDEEEIKEISAVYREASTRYPLGLITETRSSIFGYIFPLDVFGGSGWQRCVKWREATDREEFLYHIYGQHILEEK